MIGFWKVPQLLDQCVLAAVQADQSVCHMGLQGFNA
jgi:hypothetical protein